MLVSDDNERNSREIMNKEHHCKKKQHGATVSKYAQHKEKERRSNASTVINGVECNPLLLGKVQFGTVNNDQRQLLLE